MDPEFERIMLQAQGRQAAQNVGGEMGVPDKYEPSFHPDYLN
jgi:hypothetical protein